MDTQPKLLLPYPALSLPYPSLRKKCPYSEFFWSVFPRIWTKYGDLLRFTKYGDVNLRIQFKCGKIRTRKTPNMDTFYAMLILNLCLIPNRVACRYLCAFVVLLPMYSH